MRFPNNGYLKYGINLQENCFDNIILNLLQDPELFPFLIRIIWWLNYQVGLLINNKISLANKEYIRLDRIYLWQNNISYEHYTYTILT